MAKISIKIGDDKFQDNELYVNKMGTNYVYLFSGEHNDIDSKVAYDVLDEDVGDDVVAALNYTVETAPFNRARYGMANRDVNIFDAVTVAKREIWRNPDGTSGAEKLYTPAIITNQSNISDYNLRNHRYYDYVIYFSYDTDSGRAESTYYYQKPFKIDWSGWTITELHPTDDTKVYTATSKDIWKFKYNVSIGENKQEFSKNQQDTLSSYPVISHSPKRGLSGSVSCLLGKDMMPYAINSKEYEYVYEDGRWQWKPIGNPVYPLLDLYTGPSTGGYTEKLSYDTPYKTSNEAIDMLEAWREVCYSGNPKLLKDTKGNSYIIQIIDASNQTNDTWNKMPDTISFSWVKTGDTKDCQIIGIGGK